MNFHVPTTPLYNKKLKKSTSIKEKDSTTTGNYTTNANPSKKSSKTKPKIKKLFTKNAKINLKENKFIEITEEAEEEVVKDKVSKERRLSKRRLSVIKNKTFKKLNTKQSLKYGQTISTFKKLLVKKKEEDVFTIEKLKMKLTEPLNFRFIQRQIENMNKSNLNLLITKVEEVDYYGPIIFDYKFDYTQINLNIKVLSKFFTKNFKLDENNRFISISKLRHRESNQDFSSIKDGSTTKLNHSLNTLPYHTTFSNYFNNKSKNQKHTLRLNTTGDFFQTEKQSLLFKESGISNSQFKFKFKFSNCLNHNNIFHMNTINKCVQNIFDDIQAENLYREIETSKIEMNNYVFKPQESSNLNIEYNNTSVQSVIHKSLYIRKQTTQSPIRQVQRLNTNLMKNYSPLLVCEKVHNDKLKKLGLLEGSVPLIMLNSNTERDRIQNTNAHKTVKFKSTLIKEEDNEGDEYEKLKVQKEVKKERKKLKKSQTNSLFNKKKTKKLKKSSSKSEIKQEEVQDAASSTTFNNKIELDFFEQKEDDEPLLIKASKLNSMKVIPTSEFKIRYNKLFFEDNEEKSKENKEKENKAENASPTNKSQFQISSISTKNLNTTLNKLRNLRNMQPVESFKVQQYKARIKKVKKESEKIDEDSNESDNVKILERNRKQTIHNSLQEKKTKKMPIKSKITKTKNFIRPIKKNFIVDETMREKIDEVLDSLKKIYIRKCEIEKYDDNLEFFDNDMLFENSEGEQYSIIKNRSIFNCKNKTKTNLIRTKSKLLEEEKKNPPKTNTGLIQNKNSHSSITNMMNFHQKIQARSNDIRRSNLIKSDLKNRLFIYIWTNDTHSFKLEFEVFNPNPDLINSKSLRSLLMDSVLAENPDMVKFLIEKGADVNTIDLDGNTAMHYACGLRNYEIIDMLIIKKADQFIRNKKNQLCWDLLSIHNINIENIGNTNS